VKLNLDLDDSLIDRMDEVLKEKNIPRDSFVNRVLFFLLASDRQLDYLDIEYDTDSPASARPLDDAKGFLLNPFFHIRSKNEGKFYTLVRFADGPFGKNGPNLFGLNTAVSEEIWNLMNAEIPDLFETLGPALARETVNATH
jgi:hypothetical protein